MYKKRTLLIGPWLPDSGLPGLLFPPEPKPGKGPCPNPWHHTPFDPDYDPDNYGPDQRMRDRFEFPYFRHGGVPPPIKPPDNYGGNNLT